MEQSEKSKSLMLSDLKTLRYEVKNDLYIPIKYRKQKKFSEKDKREFLKQIEPSIHRLEKQLKGGKNEN